MYIAPDAKIYFLQGVPLNNDYRDTLYFNTRAEQTSYFEGRARYRLTEQSYQRVNKGVARVELKAEDLFACNYMMFQNTAYGSTWWFYAFITSVDYVNNVTCDVHYEIDVMQTWHFAYHLDQCMVEREHSATDKPGEHTLPENLETGPYTSTPVCFDGPIRYVTVIAATFDQDLNDYAGGEYAGIFSGCMYHAFETPDDASAFLQKVSNKNKADGIVSVFLMDSRFVTGPGEGVKSYTENALKVGYIWGIEGGIQKRYEPKNKKLLTWPYNFLYAYNFQGRGAEYRFEFFQNDECEFMLWGDMSCNPSVAIVPLKYNDQVANFEEMFMFDGYPQLSYNIDTFRAWVAQKGGSIAVQALGSALGALAVGTAMPAAGAMALAGVASNVSGALSQTYERSVIPPQARGGGGSTSLAAIGALKPIVYRKQIHLGYARLIDNYFSLYGYASHRVKVPNRDVRPHWTFTKTVNCSPQGNGVPADDLKRIGQIYDAGVRFWKNPAEVGDYTLDNSP